SSPGQYSSPARTVADRIRSPLPVSPAADPALQQTPASPRWITAPGRNAVVGPCTAVTFESTGLPPGMAFVLGIFIPQHNAWHFTADNLVQIAPGVWSKTSQSLGDASYGKGAPFIIGVYVMRKSELDALSDNETNPWDPAVPPADATRLASVSVVRNTHDLS